MRVEDSMKGYLSSGLEPITNKSQDISPVVKLATLHSTSFQRNIAVRDSLLNAHRPDHGKMRTELIKRAQPVIAHHAKDPLHFDVDNIFNSKEPDIIRQIESFICKLDAEITS
ncbi:hypothetical protein AMECASPLE_009595 [Ameca splendens]|uniref:Uncharacterized protein n=1 Tax=Ameca splendens TaxID=208324 RepID=A0ABV0ZBD1_9TELE